jgi:hypothetical protein
MKYFIKKHVPGGFWKKLRALKHSALYAFRMVVERCGFVITRKRDFYSPLPSETELRKTRSRWARPSALTGVAYDLDAMKNFVLELKNEFYSEFSSLPAHRELCRIGYGPGYPHVDAFTLFAMIRKLRPARYFEVGSGLSTYYCSLARQLNRKEGRDTSITCIEPFPFAKLREIEQIELLVQEIQDIPLSHFDSLASGDVLFIDSSHVVRQDGDVPFLFLEVLPRLASGVHVHIHDIPFPYNIPYPPEFWTLLDDPQSNHWPMYWTEAMLLQALLAFNPKLEIVLSLPLIRFFEEDFVRETLPIYKPVSEEANTFSSIWLKRT